MPVKRARRRVVRSRAGRARDGVHAHGDCFFEMLSIPLTRPARAVSCSSGRGRSSGWVTAVTVNPCSSTSTRPAVVTGDAQVPVCSRTAAIRSRQCLSAMCLGVLSSPESGATSTVVVASARNCLSSRSRLTKSASMAYSQDPALVGFSPRSNSRFPYSFQPHSRAAESSAVLELK